MDKKRLIKIISLLMVFIIPLSFLSGCGGKEDPEVSSHVPQVKEPGDPKVNTEKVLQVPGNWDKPPAFNGNYHSAGGWNSLNDLLYERLFVIIRVGTGNQYNQLAESIENLEDKTIIHLRKDVKWHDGELFTSKDIWAFYMLRNSVDVLKYTTSIETPDEHTFIFNWAEPYLFEDMRMKLIAKDVNGTIPYHIYKEYVDKAAEIIAAAKPATDIKERSTFGLQFTKDEKKALNDNYTAFTNFVVPNPIGTGPYKFKSVDDNLMIVVKNEDYYGANNVHFEKINFVRAPADIAQSNAMLRNGDFDISWDSPTQDMLESTLAANPDLVYYKEFDLASYGILFNLRKEPFDNIEFRKAIAYIIDKTKVREVANYYAKEFKEISAAGLPPTFLEDILLPDTKLTDFTRNEAKAEKILKELGWKKGNDGIWVDPSGKKPEFLIASDASFGITLNSAQVVAEQLTNFGLNTKVKAVESSVFWTEVRNGEEYHMTCYLMDMNWDMNEPWGGLRNSYRGTMKEVTDFPEVIELPARNGEIINVDHELDRYIYTQDENERLKILNDLIHIYHENVYAVNLFQTSYGTYINLKNIDGNLPMESEFDKYNRNMPFAEDLEVNDRICELNVGFQSNRFFVDGNYWPK